MDSDTYWCVLRPRIRTASGPSTRPEDFLRTAVPADRSARRTLFGIQGGRILARCTPRPRVPESARFLPTEHDRAETLAAPVVLVERRCSKAAPGRQPEVLFVWRHRRKNPTRERDRAFPVQAEP